MKIELITPGYFFYPNLFLNGDRKFPTIEYIKSPDNYSLNYHPVRRIFIDDEDPLEPGIFLWTSNNIECHYIEIDPAEKKNCHYMFDEPNDFTIIDVMPVITGNRKLFHGDFLLLVFYPVERKICLRLQNMYEFEYQFSFLTRFPPRNIHSLKFDVKSRQTYIASHKHIHAMINPELRKLHINRFQTMLLINRMKIFKPE